MFFYCDPVIKFNRVSEDPSAARHSSNAKSQYRGFHRPRLDLYKSDDNTNTMTAIFELPGFTSESISIDVHQNRLTISAERIAPESEEGRRYVVRELHAGKFSRTLTLPFGTKTEDVKAKMENGVLTISFPKTNPEQEAKRIVIQ